MATRVNRKSTMTAQGTSVETPKSSESSPARRTRSPSPARITRMQEKEQLQNLNDRLAAYIDKVRFLESENSKLNLQVKSTEETVSCEVENIKGLYESELAEARKLLDDTAREKARVQLEADKYKTEGDDWQAKYKKRDKDAKAAEKKMLELQAEIGDLNAKLSDADNNKKHAEGEVVRLCGEIAALDRQIANLKKQFGDETLLRVDTENRILSLKEELEFKNQVHEKELNDIRTRTTTTYDDHDGEVHAEYQTKLQDALHAIRAEQEEQMRIVREEFEELYDRKVSDLQGALDRSMSVGTSSREDNLVTKRKIDEMGSEITKLKAQNAAYESRIKDLENQLQNEQELFDQRLLQKDAEIQELRQSIDDQIQEYADLLDVKLRLDTEIEAYRKLLEGEEDRLSLSHALQEGTPKVGRKRKRVTPTTTEHFSSSQPTYEYASDASAKGAIEIHDTDHEGKFIKLFNTGNEDVVLRGWYLKHVAGDKETTYKFHRNLILKAGQFTTVWSSNSGQTHSPPTDLVMKNQQWFTADEMKTSLYHEEQEVAFREMKKTERLMVSTYKQGDEVDARADKCSIM